MSSTKAELRKTGLRQRDTIAPEAREAFAARLATIGPGLLQGIAPLGGRAVASLFTPIGSEPDVMPLALALHAADVQLALPVDWSPGRPLIYRRWIPGDRLAPGPLGIAEPLEDAPELEPDILFIPVAAFDRRGTRIGYGAGNVDSTLAGLRRRKAVRAIGIAYAAQEQPSIASEAHDEPMDLVVTDHEILYCAEATPA